MGTSQENRDYIKKEGKWKDTEKGTTSINDMPRKILNYDTVRELFDRELARLQATAPNST